MPKVAIPPFTVERDTRNHFLGATHGPDAHAVIGDAARLARSGRRPGRPPPGTHRMTDVMHYPDAGPTLAITDRRHRVFTDAGGRFVAGVDHPRPTEGDQT